MPESSALFHPGRNPQPLQNPPYRKNENRKKRTRFPFCRDLFGKKPAEAGAGGCKEEEYLYVKPLGKEKLLLILEQMLSSGKFQVRLKAYDLYEGRERGKRPFLWKGEAVPFKQWGILCMSGMRIPFRYTMKPLFAKNMQGGFCVISYWVSGDGKKIYAEDINGELYSGDIPADGGEIHFQPFFEGFYNVHILGEGNGAFFLDAVDPRTLRRETYLLNASGGYVMEKLGQYAPVEAGFSLGEDGSEVCVLKEGSSVFCRSPERGRRRRNTPSSPIFPSIKPEGILSGSRRRGKKLAFRLIARRENGFLPSCGMGRNTAISAYRGSGYFPEDSCLVLSYNGTKEKGLVFWFLKEDADKPSKLDLEKIEKTPKSIPTSGLKAMEQNYERAENLGKKYGLEIQIGEKIDFTPSDFTIEKEMDPQKVSQALHELEQSLDRYPEGFFEQLCYENIRGIKIALTGTLLNSGNPDAISEAGGYVKTAGKYMEVAVSIAQGEGSVYSTVYHEISHLIDNRLTYADLVREDCLFSEEAWNSYNPPGFSYDYAYNGAHYSNGDRDDRYFLDSYSMTYPTEDRAVLMSMAMTVDADAPWNPFASSPVFWKNYPTTAGASGMDSMTGIGRKSPPGKRPLHFMGQQLKPAA